MVDVGVQPTPTVARSVVDEDVDVGVVITPSHNPVPDNEIKLWRTDGRAFGEDANARISEIVEREAFDFAVWNALGDHSRVDG